VEAIHKIIINLEVSHHFKTSLNKMLNPFLTTKIQDKIYKIKTRIWFKRMLLLDFANFEQMF
jgi:hypothetical protein